MVMQRLVEPVVIQPLDVASNDAPTSGAHLPLAQRGEPAAAMTSADVLRFEVATVDSGKLSLSFLFFIYVYHWKLPTHIFPMQTIGNAIEKICVRSFHEYTKIHVCFHGFK